MINCQKMQAFLVITFRRSLAWSSASLLGRPGTVYRDARQRQLFSSAHPVLTVVVNSLSRCKGTWDYLILDEIVSIVDSLTSSTIDPASRVSILGTLARLAHGAKKIILADAAMEPAAIDLMMLASGLKNEDLEIVDYLHRNHADYTFHPEPTI